MKRFIKTLILCLLLCAVALSMIACGDSFAVKDDFKATTGESKDGGFVAETEKFYYVINGIGDPTSENEFGKALGKGSLLAVNKNDLSKSAVVVPKLFVASDYNAGVYIFGGRVYFATPSTDKELSGAVKSGSLVFASCKLDGTEYTEYVTINAESAEFRFVQLEDKTVLIFYYDSTEKALVEYNTNSKTAKTIIKTDATKEESLSAYKFFDNANLDKGIVAYTVDVYTGDLIEGSRGNSAKYNKMYIYKVGEKNDAPAKNGFNVTLQDEKYTIKAIVNGEVVYTVTTSNDTKGVTYIGNGDSKDATIDSAKFDVPYLYAGDSFYTINKDKTEITKDEKTFAKVSDVTTLLFVNGDFVYYINADSKIARVKQDAEYEDNKGDLVTEKAIATDWYKPQVENNVLFYCDNSATGGSNIKYIDLTAEKLQAKYLLENKVAELDERLDNISTLLTNGRIEDVKKVEQELADIDTLYNAISEDEKASLKEKYDGLNVYRDAVNLSKLSEENLKDIDKKLTDKLAEDDEAKFNAVDAEFAKIEAKGQDYLNKVCNMMEQNSYHWFRYAKTNLFKKA